MSFELIELAHHILIDAKNCSEVEELSAVVGCGEDGDEFAFECEFVALFDDLVRAADEVEVVSGEEVVYYIPTVIVSDASFYVVCPAFDGRFGVGPEHVRDQFVL